MVNADTQPGYCGKCGRPSGDGDTFCRSCGANLVDGGVDTVPESPEPAAQTAESLRRRPGESALKHVLRIYPVEDVLLWATAADEARASFRELLQGMRNDAEQGQEESRVCRSCYAYSHRFLDSCVGCGRPLTVQVNPVVYIRTREDMLRRVLQDEAATGRALRSSPDDMAKSAASSWNFRAGMTPEEFVAEQLAISAQVAREEPLLNLMKPSQSLEAFRRLEFRYLGGLSSYQGETDVRIEPRDEGLLVNARELTIATISYQDILGSWPFPDEIAVSATGFGFFSNRLAYFPNPKYRGGGLAIAAVIGSEPVVVAIGNRSGWLTPKGDLKAYASLSIALASVCVLAAGTYEGRLGPVAYANSLGLELPRVR